VAATALNAAVGIPLAYALARRRFHGRAWSTSWSRCAHPSSHGDRLLPHRAARATRCARPPCTRWRLTIASTRRCRRRERRGAVLVGLLTALSCLCWSRPDDWGRARNERGPVRRESPGAGGQATARVLPRGRLARG
jgi:hypothetical protein